MDKNDTHRQLLQLVYEYVKANILLEQKVSLNKTIEVRRLLSEIRRCATQRRKEIMDVQVERKKQLDIQKGRSNSEEADDQDD